MHGPRSTCPARLARVDPTNGTVGGDDLIRVAVARDIHQIVPISGTFQGTAVDYLGMEVTVTVRTAPSPARISCGARIAQRSTIAVHAFTPVGRGLGSDGRRIPHPSCSRRSGDQCGAPS